jgi:DNA modification methylase
MTIEPSVETKIINDDFRNHLALFSQDAFIISDPPYNQNYHYSEYADNLHIDDYAEMLSHAFKDQKSVIISYPEETINILGKILDKCEQVVSWVYPSNTAKQSRLITWWGCKPDLRKVGQNYKNPTDKRIAKRIAEGKTARLYDWWEINQVKNVSKKDNPHPCPIPYEVAERIILITTNEGDLVIDPFAGSGTILLAAKNNHRRYLGFEIDKTYFDYAKEALND